MNEDGKLTLIGSTRDITEQRKQEKKLKERARKDSLTGLYNQVYGKKCINKYLNRKKPFDSCGMIVLDVDCFKLVNDNYGHLFGDKVLACLAMLLKEVFRDNDSILMRAGGDEFVIFVKDILNIELVRKNVELMQKIRSFNSGRQVVRSHVVQDVVIFQRMYQVIPMTNCLRMRTLPYIKQKSEERTVMFTVTACSIFHP